MLLLLTLYSASVRDYWEEKRNNEVTGVDVCVEQREEWLLRSKIQLCESSWIDQMFMVFVKDVSYPCVFLE